MIVHLAVVLAVSTAAALTAEPLSRRLAPASAVRLLTAVAVLTGLLTLWVLTALALGGLGEVPWLADRLECCQSITQVRHDVPLGLSALAAVALVALAVRAARLIRGWRELAVEPSSDALAVIPTAEAVAYVVPGRPGHIVASQGMLSLLDAQERRAMLAHEQAHLDLAHHRYLRAAELAAGVPLLRPVARANRYATERWADEEAAVAVGDRRLVARALSRAALATPPSVPAGAVGLVGEGMVERVTGLMDRPMPSLDPTQAVLLAVTVATLIASAAVTVRLHDVATALTHMCGFG